MTGNFGFRIADGGLPKRVPGAGGFRRSAIGNPPAAISRRGSVLVIVIVLLMFTTFALIAFMERASNDLLVDQREAISRRLRAEAYSALEVTLAVLNDFREVNNGLRSPAEGWGDPLTFAGYTPNEDRTVEVAFEDESGKISLPHANDVVLKNLFKSWGLADADGETLTDALLGWMKKDHVYKTSIVPDYDMATLPYEAPGRPIRSYAELAAIDKVRDFFYDSEGRPNDLWRRFVAAVSLLDFPRSNINAARPDALAALGQFDATQQQNLMDYLNGTGTYQTQGPAQPFKSANEAQRIVGPSGDAGAFGTAITALRIFITVHEGRSEFRLAATIAPPNGANIVTTTAQHTETQGAGAAKTAQQQQQQPNAAQQKPPDSQANARNLKYPFTLLEIRENDEIPPPPPAPPATGENPI